MSPDRQRRNQLGRLSAVTVLQVNSVESLPELGLGWLKNTSVETELLVETPAAAKRVIKTESLTLIREAKSER